MRATATANFTGSSLGVGSRGIGFSRVGLDWTGRPSHPLPMSTFLRLSAPDDWRSEGQGELPRGILRVLAGRAEIPSGKPMTLTVDLPDDLVRRLQERASRQGRAIEEYVVGLIERDAAGPENGRDAVEFGAEPGQAPALSDSAFDRLLDELASGSALPPLPADFSRADIYAEHD
jgi:plasmid stability protein